MRTEYNKGHVADPIISMEEVVMQTATGIGEIGVQQNERELLQAELGPKKNNVFIMANNLVTKQ